MKQPLGGGWGWEAPHSVRSEWGCAGGQSCAPNIPPPLLSFHDESISPPFWCQELVLQGERVLKIKNNGTRELCRLCWPPSGGPGLPAAGLS